MSLHDDTKQQQYTEAAWRLWYQQVGQAKLGVPPKPEKWEQYTEPVAMAHPPDPSAHTDPAIAAKCPYCHPRMVTKSRRVE